jgi:hypothetical protein
MAPWLLWILTDLNRAASHERPIERSPPMSTKPAKKSTSKTAKNPLAKKVSLRSPYAGNHNETLVSL